MDQPTNREFNYISVCAGVGGLDQGLKIAIPSARCRLYLEREAACCELLAIRMEEGSLDQAPIFTDLRTFDGRPWRGRIHCLMGGIPCQPHSVAGKQGGTSDPRDLWPDTRRLIREIEPPYVLIENVSNFVNTILFDVARDFQEMGYMLEVGLFAAEETGAPHKRERLFILGYNRSFELAHTASISRGC